MNNGEGIFTLDEFYSRGVTKLAPDALVYIGGGLNLSVLSPVANKEGTLSLNSGITSINVQNVLDPPGSSTATIEVVTPIYGENSAYWINFPGRDGGTPVRAPVFVPMMEVRIFFKGRFLVGMEPKYYPSFWGFITNVEESYSGGVYKITLSCADMLHWWSYSKINVHPVPTSSLAAGGYQPMTVWSTIFDEKDPFSIIYQLTQDMGEVSFVTPTWSAQKTGLESIYPSKVLQRAVKGDLMSYWKERFKTLGNLLKMYGAFGQEIVVGGMKKSMPITHQADRSKAGAQALNATRLRNKNQYGLDPNFMRSFPTFAQLNKMGSFKEAEYMTKLEIATEVKTRTDFEFFQDVNGNFVYKPPFYNLDIKGLQPYTLKPNEIINYSQATDVEGVTTVLEVNLPFDQLLRQTQYMNGKGFHMDIDLCKKYGIRYNQVTFDYINDEAFAKTLAAGHMALINAKTITGSVTLPGRPEMRLGYPVFIEHRDSYHYVRSINHAFDYAGSFTTSLALETERRKLYLYEDNEWKNVLKDTVYRYAAAAINAGKINPEDPPQIATTDLTGLKYQNAMISENLISSLKQGEYVITPRDKSAGDIEKALTNTTVPYTDEEGYRLIGAFPYGRGLNPVCIGTDMQSNPISMKSYLATMLDRPSYKSESDAMNGLFFSDKEGAVPAYYSSPTNDMPSMLGVPSPDPLLIRQQTLEQAQGITKKSQQNRKNLGSRGTADKISSMKPASVGTPDSSLLMQNVKNQVLETNNVEMPVTVDASPAPSRALVASSNANAINEIFGFNEVVK